LKTKSLSTVQKTGKKHRNEVMGLFGCYKRKLLFTVEEAFIPYSKVDKNDGLVPVDIEANW